MGLIPHRVVKIDKVMCAYKVLEPVLYPGIVSIKIKAIREGSMPEKSYKDR